MASPSLYLPGELTEKKVASFDDLLSGVGKAHKAEIEEMKRKYEADVKYHRDDAERLREQLKTFKRLSMRSEGQGPLLTEDGKVPFDEMFALEDLKAIDLQVEGEHFGLLGGWKKPLPADAGYNFERTMKLYNDAEPGQRPPRIDASGQVVQRHGCVILPSCGFRLAWDVTGLVLIAYDLMTIPFDQAFQPPDSPFSITMDWITLIFWSGDMIQGFFLGYYAGGTVILDNKKIFFNYVKTWLIVDAIVVLPEWSMKLLPVDDGGAGAGDLGKIAKFARVARVLRLLRLLKMKKLLETLVDRIESEYSFILFNMVQLLVFVLILNHVIACVWYLIGRLAMGEQIMNWIDVSKVRGSDISYLYATSLHWSLTQFTPASMDISARNLWERLFSVLVLLFAMLVFSSIVASITAAMTALRNLQGNEMRQFWLLRRYLRQRTIPKNLSNRIIKFLEHRSAIQGKLVQRDKVPILANLSEALQDELSHEMHAPELKGHPFFSTLKEAMPAMMHRLCRLSLSLQLFAVEDWAFNSGDEANKMYFIKSGELDYHSMEDIDPISLVNKDWLSEPVLFTLWRHRGSLQACTEAELINIDPKQFMTVMSVHPRPWHYAVSYARVFVKYLNMVETAERGDEIDDICQFPGMYDKLMAACNMTGEGNHDKEADGSHEVHPETVGKANDPVSPTEMQPFNLEEENGPKPPRGSQRLSQREREAEQSARAPFGKFVVSCPKSFMSKCG